MPAALLVGATRGIGRAVAAELARRGWKLLIVGRDAAAGDEAVREAVRAAGSKDANAATFLACDVSLQAEVRGLAERVRTLTPTLDLIVHSADVLRTKRADTSEGIESAFAINCLSRVLLNGLLMPIVNAGGAIVHVAAAGMPGSLDPENLPPPPGMGAVGAHNLGQRANDLYGLTLAQRSAARGVRVMVMQPGMVDTSIRRSGVAGPVLRTIVPIAEALMRPLMTRPDDYARGLVALIERERSAPVGGGVLFDRRFRSMRVPTRYTDRDLAARAWSRLHKAVGLDPGAI